MAEYKVLDVLSETRLVLGCGIEDGIDTATEFFIYGLGPMLQDDTGKEYERLELIRGYAKAIHVQQKICTVQSNRTMEKRTQLPNAYFGISAGLTKPEYETVTVSRPFVEPKVGDLARVISTAKK